MAHFDTGDEMYMRRALQLAALGFGDTNPNPMVGAVIAGPDGRIIGEGWHRRCGQGHAEVNAVASVSESDAGMLPSATMYVTLEPCSHWGRTPPCARLIIDKGIRHVVVAATDPFAAVSGRGIALMRDAGITVRTGLMAEDSRCLNAMFMTANEQHRPFVTLKWAQSADGFIDGRRTPAHPGAYAFSTPFTRLTGHRLRTAHQAVIAGSGTFLADRPRLNSRLWTGPQPIPVALDRRHRLKPDELPAGTIILDSPTPAEALDALYDRGITSVLVEGGAKVLQSFIDSGLWDAMRIETAPSSLGENGTVSAPSRNGGQIIKTDYAGHNRIDWYSNNALVTASHPLLL